VHSLPITALRYFNAYGPRQGTSSYANVIAIFFQRVREGKPLTTYGDGEQTRDFVYVGDIIRANILAATSPQAIGEIFNIGTGQAASVNQLISIISKLSGRELQVIRAAPRVGEVKHSRANIDKARRLLGYEPETDIHRGLSLTWQSEMLGNQ
jgi:UDP-glucose 4-epimerase